MFVQASIGKSSRDFSLVVVDKLYYDFWYEPNPNLGLQFKLKVYKECSHPLGGSASYVHDYFSNPFVKVESASAKIISSKGKKTNLYEVQKYNYKGPGIIYSESDHYSYIVPEVEMGSKSVSEVVYTFRDSRSIIPIFFAEEFMVNELKINFVTPEGVSVNPYFHLCDSADFTVKKSALKKENLLEISRKNIPGIHTQKNDDINSSYYSPFIYLQIKGAKVEDVTIHSLSSIGDLYQHNYNFLMMTEKADTLRLKAIVDTLTSSRQSEKQNLEKIFNWVRDNIKYTGIMEGKKTVVPESASDVLNSTFGDCKGMSSLLNGMAGAAGIPLHYGWVGTREISFQPTQIPIPYAFNHMIGIYIQGNDTLVLDATSKSAAMGEVSSHLYGKEVLVELGNDQFFIYKIPTPSAEKNKLHVNALYTPEESNWQATYTANIEGQKKILFDYINKTPASSFRKNKRPNPVFPEMQTENISISELSKADEPKAKMSWQQPLEGVIKTSNSLSFNPFPDKYKDLLKIETEDRKMPIEMEYPFQDQYVITITIPDGYVLGSQPETVNYTDKLGEINYETTLDGNKLVAIFSIKLNPLLIYPEDFEQFTNLKNILKKCISEYIVFKKQE